MIRGMVRKIDDLGRVTLPIEMRRAQGFKENEPVDIYFENGVICIRSASLQCVCCGSTKEDKLTEVKKVLICEDCIQEAKGAV